MGKLKNNSILLGILLLAVMITGCGKSAGNSYRRGIKAFENRDYEMAEEYFLEAVEKNKEKAEYYISYGLTLMVNEKYEEALEQLKKAVVDKDNQIVLENNKIAYRAMGIVFYRMQDYSSAVEMLEKALDIKELRSMNRDIMCYLAECEEALLEYEKAVTYYEEILSLKESVYSYAKKALLEKKQGDFEAAIEDCDKAISMEKENYDLYFQKYYFLIAQGQESEAGKVLDQVAGIKAKTNGEQYGQSKLYYFLNKEEMAKEGFEKSLEKGYAEAGFYLGQIEQENGRFKKAEEYYINYIESGKRISSAAVYNQLGICYLELGEYEFARDTFSLGLKVNDSEMKQELKFNRVIAYERLGNFEKAYKRAKEYLEEYPEDSVMKKEKQFIKTRLK